MNRPGTTPQALRGMPNGPNGFGGQPQGRAASNRLPNGKLANNGVGWAFGNGVPMSSAALPNTARPLGGNIGFAQSLSASQPSTPLDPLDFPSLSNNTQSTNTGQTSMWSGAGARGIGGPAQRGQAPAAGQQSTDDLFSSAVRIAPNQASFRFGNQDSATAQFQPGSIDEFPPLSRNMNNELGQERNVNLMSTIGYTAQSNSSAQANRGGGNGLLNALSANARATESASAANGPQAPDTRSSAAEDESRSKTGARREENRMPQAPGSDRPGAAAAQMAKNPNPLGTIGHDAPSGKAKADKGKAREYVDPLDGMSETDKWGLKGLMTLMNNYPDYNALVCGIDPSTLGLDLNSPERISDKIYSLFDDTPPRPAVPNFRLPDCYNVTNVQPIEQKISSFNEDTLFWIFFSSPGDVKQQWAALELYNRNWRWHKKLQIWLTKDECMVPQTLGPSSERGYYIVWDTTNWQKERRELTLHYSELDNPTATN